MKAPNSAVVDKDTGIATPEWLNWLQGIADTVAPPTPPAGGTTPPPSTSSSGPGDGSVITITNNYGSGTANRITKWIAAQQLGDSIMRESGDTIFVSGTLNANVLQGSFDLSSLTSPVANAIFLADGSKAVSFSPGVPFHLLPMATDTYDLGSATKLWRQGFLGQLNAILFAKETQTLYGGWLSVSKNAGTFAARVAEFDTSIDFGTLMVAGQFVLVRAITEGGFPSSEYFKVLALVSGTRYTVARNLSGLGAQRWPEGTAFQVRGVTGDGWIELNAYDTPRMSIFVQGTLYNNSQELLRIGYLTGMPNSSTGIGAYMGDSANYLRWDGSALTLKSATCTIDSSGIRVLAGGAGVIATLNGYTFSNSWGAQMGMYAADQYPNGLVPSSLYLYNDAVGPRSQLRIQLGPDGSQQCAIWMGYQAGGSGMTLYSTNVVAVSGALQGGVSSSFPSSLTVGTSIVQKTGAYLFPGSVSGLSDYQSSYYLASHASWGLYVNAGLYVSGALTAAGNVYAQDTMFIKSNGGSYAVLSTVPGVYLGVITLDGSNLTTILCNNDTLRFADITAGTGGSFAAIVQQIRCNVNGVVCYLPFYN